MKRISLFALFLCSCASQRGMFVDRGMYNNSPFASATASSPDEARSRAMAAIPQGFEIDEDFKQPVLSCGKPGEMPEWDESVKAFARCGSGTYRVDVALLPKTGLERSAILSTRRDLATSQGGEPAAQ